MGYPVEECNPDELLTDGDFDKAPGAWTVGAQWTIDGLGKAVFGGPSAVETKISQTIDIVEDHLLEIKMTVDSVFWLFPPKSFQLKIGGASSPALTIAKPYVFYLLPSLFGSQLFEITANTPAYDIPDSIFISHVSCIDVVCLVGKDDIVMSQPDVFYDYSVLSDERIMLNYGSSFDHSGIIVIRDPDYP